MSVQLASKNSHAYGGSSLVDFIMSDELQMEGSFRG
jgi:hypothetical protein